MPAARYTTHTLYRRLLRQSRPYWAHIAGIFLLNLLSTPLVLLTPLPLKIAVDSVLGSQPLPRFLEVVLPVDVAHSDSAILVLTIGLVVAYQPAGTYYRRSAAGCLQTYTGEKLVLGFRSQLFRHVQRLSLSYHDTKGTADSTYRIQYDAPSQWLLHQWCHAICHFWLHRRRRCSMSLLRIDWQLALVALAVSPVLFSYSPWSHVIACAVGGMRSKSFKAPLCQWCKKC